ncbi:hypothetical protein [Sphingobacterium faecale]|uniref:Uncharacterized protein n=1 Tax=Sphingobacterium faecale TaxID=2803775 RepID=A0ABS1R464_9SPHI|nr:hypothetical protein [Sphingobacterium faecale]MBL1409478.1 hypothetical protein [Sphingobacterium faecale]
MKRLLLILLTTTIGFTALAQEQKATSSKTSTTYAYVTVSNKTLSKKLKVNVDLGDTPEQQEEGNRLSDELYNKESHAAILNYMAEKNFELVETIAKQHPHSTNAGALDGIVFIMRKSQQHVPQE